MTDQEALHAVDVLVVVRRRLEQAKATRELLILARMSTDELAVLVQRELDDPNYHMEAA